MTGGDEPAARREGEPLALYVHWPGELDEEGRLVSALIQASTCQLGPRDDAFRLASVLIGGDGPPPSPPAVSRLLQGLAAEISTEAEISLEAVAEAGLAGMLADYRGAGVSRLVIRAVILDDATASLLTAARSVVERVALDLTFGRPGQTESSFVADLERAAALGIGHLSLAEHTPDDPELGADLYLSALRALPWLGLPHYDIAHFARPGEESQHHLHVARGGPYAAIGPGTAARLPMKGRWWVLEQTNDPTAWLSTIERGGDALVERRALSRDERAMELVTSGLRLRTGIARSWFEPLIGGPLEEALPGAALRELIDDGFLELDPDGLRLTVRGWPLCDAVLRRLLP